MSDHHSTQIKPDALQGRIHPLSDLYHGQRNPSTSTFSSFSTSSTIPGVGMISGRAIKRVGGAIVQLAEEAVIWRRLRFIRRQFDDEISRRKLLSDPKTLYNVVADIVELLK